MSQTDGACFSGGSGSSRNRPIASVPPEALDYNMDHPKRGIALILNYVDFLIPDYSRRSGSDIDCRKLVAIFKKLNFKVIIPPDNLTRLKTLRKLEEVSMKDHTERDCFVLCYLSHGEAGGRVAACDAHIYYDEIFSFFSPNSCPSLAGKPKMFFFQACQGDEEDDGVRLRTDGYHRSTMYMDYKIPLQADYLVAYSTVPNHVSYRESDIGSRFINSLVAELETHFEYLDIASIMTLVCRKVAIEFESTPMRSKQVPFWTSTLTRFVRFTYNNKNNNNNNNIGYANGTGNHTKTDNPRAEDQPKTDNPGDGDQTSPNNPGTGDQTGHNNPGPGDQTSPIIPGDGDQTSPIDPGDGDHTRLDNPGDGDRPRKNNIKSALDDCPCE